MGGVVAGAMFLIAILSPISASDPNPQVNNTAQTSPIHSPTPTKSASIHVVEAGESINSIAKKYYGSEKFWTNVWNANSWIEDPRSIKKGEELKVGTLTKEPEKLSQSLSDKYDLLIKPTLAPTLISNINQQVAGVQASSLDDVYKNAGAKYGVPWEVLYGIHLTETGLRDGAISSGYGTGAQGPMQFLPDTWAHFGVDGNGDGNVDINNAADAIFGAANYLSAHGGVEAGLRSYGGDTTAILNAAKSRGYNP